MVFSGVVNKIFTLTFALISGFYLEYLRGRSFSSAPPQKKYSQLPPPPKKKNIVIITVYK